MSLPVNTPKNDVRDWTPPSPQRWLRLSRDGCPECLNRWNEPQLLMVDLRTEGMQATYRCLNCGHQWWTGWAIELLEAAD